MELLAPAKDLDTLICAFDAGADAVYSGLKKFSARARAKNLTIEELYKAAEIKRKLKKKLYIALNTLILEDEIPEIIEFLIHIKAAEIDGLIIQDYGIFQLIKDYDLQIPLHASTQMGTKNHIQANFLKDLGFKRVILERQLTLDEIKLIRKKTNIELEVFIHGAMCFSLSGYCFFSKMLGNRSGNRGDCAQPCRWSFWDEEKNKLTRPFFMRDLSAISLLPEFKKIGIDSLKIEGRLKGTEYVYAVVSTYREALDSLDKIRDGLDLKELEKKLENAAFTRHLTRGFYIGAYSENDLKDNDLNSVGLYVGQVSSVFEKSIYFKTRVPINIGDGLRIVNLDDTTFKLPVKAIYKNNQKVRKAENGDYIGLPCNVKGILKGAKVYLVHHRFIYKRKLKIPDKVFIPDVEGKVRELIGEYGRKYSLSSSKRNVEIIKLTFKADKNYSYGGKKIAFITPDIYESKVSIYKKIYENKEIDGLFISHPSEAKIFENKNIFGSFYLYVTNKPAGFFMKNLGIEGFSLNPDLDEKTFEKIRFLSPLWFRWKDIPAWITRVPLENNLILKPQKNNKQIKTQKNLGFFKE